MGMASTSPGPDAVPISAVSAAAQSAFQARHSQLTETVYHQVSPRALQEAFDTDGIRARLRLLRQRGPDGDPPLWLGALIVPAALALVAMAAAIGRGML